MEEDHVTYLCALQAYISQGENMSVLDTVFVNRSGEISMSVLFIYEEYKQTDFVKEFDLKDTFIDHLAMMFPSLHYTPVAENGEPIAIAPPPWDEKKVSPFAVQFHSARHVAHILPTPSSFSSERITWWRTS